MTIERVVSPGGIEAWLVRDPTRAADRDRVRRSSAAPTRIRPTSPASPTWWPTLLDEGAGDLDATAFHERLERKAIELGFRAGRDYFRGIAAHAHGAPRRGLRLAAAGADRAALRRRRRSSACATQIMSRLRRETTSPNDIASRTWWATAFPGHPYGRPVNGTLESVPRITADDLQALYAAACWRATPQDRASSATSTPRPPAELLDRIFGALPAKAELDAGRRTCRRRGSAAASSSSSTCRRRS